MCSIKPALQTRNNFLLLLSFSLSVAIIPKSPFCWSSADVCALFKKQAGFKVHTSGAHLRALLFSLWLLSWRQKGKNTFLSCFQASLLSAGDFYCVGLVQIMLQVKIFGYVSTFEPQWASPGPKSYFGWAEHVLTRDDVMPATAFRYQVLTSRGVFIQWEVRGWHQHSSDPWKTFSQ